MHSVGTDMAPAPIVETPDQLRPIRIWVSAGALLDCLQLMEKFATAEEFVAEMRRQVHFASSDQQDAKLILTVNIEEAGVLL